MSQHKEEVVKHVVQIEAAAKSESEMKDKQKQFKKAIKESEAKFLRGNTGKHRLYYHGWGNHRTRGKVLH